MRWRKLGRVWAPDGSRSWARTHALLPTPYVMDGFVRVYFAALDANKIGRVGFVDVDAANPCRVIYDNKEPILDCGPLGTFDDCGVTPSCVLPVGDEVWMYYVGWQRSFRVPYLLFTGLAVSSDGGRSFRRRQDTPVLDRSAQEPFSRGAPFVMRTPEGGFRAWYWSSTGWGSRGSTLHYNNDIRVADSEDGVHWASGGELCVGRDANAGEFSIGRPWLLTDSNRTLMWYTIRSHERPDAAGLAESLDGRRWARCDSEVNLPRSDEGWDSEMLCYPAVVRVGGRKLVFFNGNRHGESGFGVAVAD